MFDGNKLNFSRMEALYGKNTKGNKEIITFREIK